MRKTGASFIRAIVLKRDSVPSFDEYPFAFRQFGISTSFLSPALSPS
jgi:hypothetical protein